MARIGVIETRECWSCGAQEQTVIHLYKECRRWRRERRKPNRELGQHCISRQPRPERKWLGSLLANERAVVPVLEFFFEKIRVLAADKKERELEWQKRSMYSIKKKEKKINFKY